MLGQIKAEIALEAMQMMSYDMLSLGSHEFFFGVDFLLDKTQLFNLTTLNANVVFEDTHAPIAVSGIILKINNVHVGFTGIIAKEHEAPILESNAVNQKDIIVLDELAILQSEIESLQEKADITIVLASVGLDQSIALAQNTTGIDIIISGYGDEITEEPLLVNGVHIVKAGSLGTYIGRLSISLDRSKKITDAENTVIYLNTDIEEDSEMLLLMDTYHALLKEHKEELFDIVPEAPETGWYYAGYETCERCHADQAEHWLVTDHAAAFTSLAKKNQDFNPECIPCHVTGFGYIGGFMSPDATPALGGVQCEMCHGAAGEHLEKPSEQYGEIAETTCIICHTPEKNPQFDYETYYQKIKH